MHGRPCIARYGACIMTFNIQTIKTMKRILLVALVSLGFAGVVNAQGTLTDIGTNAPTPGVDDIYQTNFPYLQYNAYGTYVDGPNNSAGLNYYFDNGNPPGQTFTTGPSAVGYVLHSVAVRAAGMAGQDGTLGNNITNYLRWELYVYTVSGTGLTNATVISSNSTHFALIPGDWFQWNGLTIPLAPNTTYAFAIHFPSGQINSAWELMGAYSNNPSAYAGGEACLLPTGVPGQSGEIRYGSSHLFDAAFDLGVSIPQTPVPQPITSSGNPSAIYQNSQITLTEMATGPGPISYAWLTDNGTGGSMSLVSGSGGSVSTANTNYIADTTGFTVGGVYKYAAICSNSYGAVTSAVVALTITNASSPVLVTNTVSPATMTNFVGQSERYQVNVVGTLPIAYQWQVSPNPDGSGAVNVSAANASGANTAALVITNLQAGNSGYYSCLATNSVSPYVTNSPWTQLSVVGYSNALVQWQAPVSFNGLTAGQIITNPPGYTTPPGYSNGPGYFLEGAYFPSSATPSTITVTVGGIAYQFYGDQSRVGLADYAGGGWHSGAYIIAGSTNTTGNTDFDTILDQFAADSSVTPARMNITLKNLVPGQQYSVQLFALDDRGLASARTANFQDPSNNADISATFGMTANVYVMGTFTAQGTNLVIQENLPASQGNMNAVIVRALSYVPAFPPMFVTQPTSVGAFPGRTVHFNAMATGKVPIGYQWQANTGSGFVNLTDGSFSGVTISGSTTTNLTVAGVSLSDSGWQFQNTATNADGGTNSLAATLTVNSAPSLSGSYSTTVLGLNPVAYWPLNETQDPYNNGVSGLGVYDASGNMHDGLYQYNAFNWFDGVIGPQPSDGYTQFTAGQGAYQPSYSALGPYTNDWVNLPALNLNTNKMTITMWVYPDGAQNDYTGLLLDRNNGTKAGMCYTVGQKLGYVWNNDNQSTWSYTNGPVIPTNMWSLVAVVVSPNNASFYVINTNGVASTTYANVNSNMTWSGTSSPDPNIYLGSDSDTFHRTFNGVIDEVAVFNYDLAGSQLANMAGVPYTPPVNTNAATLDFGFKLSGTPGSQTMNFTWASDHMGWQLYTNAVGLTATNSWFPIAGSANVTNESIAIDPTKANVFYMMRYP